MLKITWILCLYRILIISYFFFFVFSKFSFISLLDIFFTVLCNWLHILIILAKAIGITEIAHFCLNYSVYALMKSDDLSFASILNTREFVRFTFSFLVDVLSECSTYSPYNYMPHGRKFCSCLRHTFKIS